VILSRCWPTELPLEVSRVGRKKCAENPSWKKLRTGGNRTPAASANATGLLQLRHTGYGNAAVFIIRPVWAGFDKTVPAFVVQLVLDHPTLGDDWWGILATLLKIFAFGVARFAQDIWAKTIWYNTIHVTFLRDASLAIFISGTSCYITDLHNFCDRLSVFPFTHRPAHLHVSSIPVLKDNCVFKRMLLAHNCPTARVICRGGMFFPICVLFS